MVGRKRQRATDKWQIGRKKDRESVRKMESIKKGEREREREGLGRGGGGGGALLEFKKGTTTVTRLHTGQRQTTPI